MVDDVRLAVNGERPVHFYGRMGGMVPTVAEVAAEIRKYGEPHLKSPAETALENAIDEKLQAVSESVKEILKKARKTLFESRVCDAHTTLNFKTGAKEKEAETMPDEHSFDEIEAKFKAALSQMKQKLQEASEKITAASPQDMERKVKEAADMMAQRIQQAAQKMEQKMAEAGLRHEEQAPEAAASPEAAARDAADAYAAATAAVKQETETAADALDEAVHAATDGPQAAEATPARADTQDRRGTGRAGNAGRG